MDISYRNLVLKYATSRTKINTFISPMLVASTLTAALSSVTESTPSLQQKDSLPIAESVVRPFLTALESLATTWDDGKNCGARD